MLRGYDTAEVFYVGESLFGYHTVDALASQAGLDNSTYVAPWLELSADHSNGSAPRVRSLSVGSEDHWYAPDAGLHLPNGHLRLIDSVEIVTGGGEFGLGYLRGTRKIDPTDWYFDCHFHRDPVMPGSLGVEAIIAGLQVWAIDAGLGRRYRRPTFALPLDVEMRWRYRGQILRGDDRMVFDLHITDLRVEADRTLLIAKANLWKPELRIYELSDIAVEIRESPGRAGPATTTGRTSP